MIAKLDPNYNHNVIKISSGDLQGSVGVDEMSRNQCRYTWSLSSMAIHRPSALQRSSVVAEGRAYSTLDALATLLHIMASNKDKSQSLEKAAEVIRELAIGAPTVEFWEP